MTKRSIFLSYAHEDRSRVEQIYDSLIAEGLNPWIDSRNILPGQMWSKVIGKAIDAASCVLIFISKNSVSKSGYIQTELRSALSILQRLPAGEIFLIPVRLDNSDPPDMLKHLHFVDLFEETGWKRLLISLQRLDKQPETPTDKTTSLSVKEEKRVHGKSKPQVFVAMPFAIEMEDVFHYGILRPLEVIDLKVNRVDKTAFVGDILNEIKNSIENSIAVVVELSGLNPNVHLELGYAWGRNIPCILLIAEGNELCFDVRGQKCLVYKSIKDLEAKLTDELKGLIDDGTISY